MEIQHHSTGVIEPTPDDPGFDSLLEAVQNYREPEEANSDREEELQTFLVDCLSPRQAEVLGLAVRGDIDPESSDARMWSKIKAGIIRHPAVIGEIALLSEDGILDGIDTPEWIGQAACIGDKRFVKPGTKSIEAKLNLLDICANCPIQAKCFGYVADKSPEAGVWAGAARRKDGKGKYVGYHEDGKPQTLDEVREELKAKLEAKKAKKAARRNGKR